MNEVLRIKGWRMEMENTLKPCGWLCGGFVMHSRNYRCTLCKIVDSPKHFCQHLLRPQHQILDLLNQI
jgi:hypothetical protein